MSVNNVYKLYIRFSGEQNFTNYDASFKNLTITENVHSGLKNADNVANCTIIHNQDLENKLRGLDDTGAEAYLTENDVKIFTGYIRKNFAFSKSVYVENFNVEIVAPSFFLKRKIKTDFNLVNASVCTDSSSIIWRLFIDAGYAAGDLVNLPTISTTLPFFTADNENDQYYDLINNLLFDYGYILDFNAEGKPIVYDISPSNLTPGGAFTTGPSGNVRNKLNQNVAINQYQKIEISWDTVKSIDNLIVFEDTTNGNSQNDCVIPVNPESYYGEDEAGSIGLYCQYDSPNYELLYATNCQLDLQVNDSANLRLEEFTDYHTQGFLKLHNVSNLIKYIYRLRIKGTGIVKQNTNITNITNSDGVFANKLSYTAKYIFDKNSADLLAQKLANYYKYNNFTYTVNSYTDYKPNTIVTLTDAQFGTLTCRIINKQTNLLTGLFVYTLEGVGPFEAAQSTAKTKDPGTSQIATAEEVKEIIDGAMDVGNPDQPVFTAIAQKDGIQLTCAAFGAGLKNSINKIIWFVKKDLNSDVWTQIGITGNLSLYYEFDRSIDGYPEIDDLQDWRFYCVAYNAYNGYTASDITAVNTNNYQTWEVAAPVVYPRISDRTITLLMSQPPRADNKTVYGTIRHYVQIRKPGFDPAGIFYKPATDLDPFINENNYKDGSGSIVVENIYSQTMPLTGQATSDIIDTLYSFKIIAFNEAGQSSETIINATALCTSIRDLVKANETAKESYIENLTALCSAFGFISAGITGTIPTEKNNYWTLNSGIVENDENNIAYAGAFRIGGQNEYLLVKPILQDGKVVSYTIDFKVGNFNVSSSESLFEGEFIVSDATNKFDRVKISPIGVFLQHRDSLNSPWYDVNLLDVSGLIAPSMRAKDQIVIGNFDQASQRQIGHDIGREYLSSAGLVYHFDDNFYSQNNQTDGIIITGNAELKGSSDSNGIDFTPALVAVAPYANVARCAYGQFKINHKLINTQTATIDFWQQYLFAESQILFDIGTDADRLQCVITPAEPLAITAGVCSWQDENENIIYTNLRNPIEGDNYYLIEQAAEVAGDVDTKIQSVVVDENNYIVNSITVADVVYNFLAGDPAANFETFAPQEIWGQTSAIAVRSNSKKTLIRHYGQIQDERILLEDFDKSFLEYEWYHIGVIFKASKIIFLFNDFNYAFNRFSILADDVDIELNGDLTSIIIDELYLDTGIEDTTDFINNTTNKIPWAMLPDSSPWFIFDAKDVTKVKSNIIDYFINQFLNSQDFRQKVLEIINE